MTLLGGDAAALFGELLAGEYLPGTLRTVTDVYDAQGNLVRQTADTPCRVQVERATERMLASEGYTATDRAIYVLAEPGGGLPTVNALDTSAQIIVEAGPYAGSVYKVSSPVDRDPAGAYWLCRAVKNG